MSNALQLMVSRKKKDSNGNEYVLYFVMSDDNKLHPIKKILRSNNSSTKLSPKKSNFILKTLCNNQYMQRSPSMDMKNRYNTIDNFKKNENESPKSKKMRKSNSSLSIYSKNNVSVSSHNNLIQLNNSDTKKAREYYKYTNNLVNKVNILSTKYNDCCKKINNLKKQKKRIEEIKKENEELKKKIQKMKQEKFNEIENRKKLLNDRKIKYQINKKLNDKKKLKKIKNRSNSNKKEQKEIKFLIQNEKMDIYKKNRKNYLKVKSEEEKMRKNSKSNLSRSKIINSINSINSEKEKEKEKDELQFLRNKCEKLEKLNKVYLSEIIEINKALSSKDYNTRKKHMNLHKKNNSCIFDLNIDLENEGITKYKNLCYNIDMIKKQNEINHRDYLKSKNRFNTVDSTNSNQNNNNNYINSNNFVHKGTNYSVTNITSTSSI